jgi:hypothetical protein
MRFEAVSSVFVIYLKDVTIKSKTNNGLVEFFGETADER